MCGCVGVWVCGSVGLSLCLYICVFVCVCVSVSVCLSVCLSVVSLSLCLSEYVFRCSQKYVYAKYAREVAC